MTEVAIAHTDTANTKLAGQHLAQNISSQLSGPPDALIVFASPVHDYKTLLESIKSRCECPVMVGCSSAGEFTSATPQLESACVLALRSSEMAFAAGLGEGLTADRKKAATRITSSFQGLSTQQYAYRTAMVLTDALAGFADSLVEELTLCTEGMYQLFGGGAGDDARFQRTHVFIGTEVYTDAAVALEILSNKPVGIGVQHGWEPASAAFRVTEAQGSTIVSLNAAPAIEAFQAHAEAMGQTFDLNDPKPFFLSNVLGIESVGKYRLRVPLGIGENGKVICAAEVPGGSMVRIMRTSSACSADAAAQAAASALAQLNSHKPKTAVFFDCVATRLRTGQDFGLELRALEDLLGPASYVGCNTYGQIARAEGQFGGFHNCTAVIGIFPE